MYWIWTIPKMSLTPSNILWNYLLPIYSRIRRTNFIASIVWTSFINILNRKRMPTKHTYFCHLAFCHFLQNLVKVLFDAFLFNDCIFCGFFYLRLPMFNCLFDKLVHKVSFLFVLRQSSNFLLGLQKLSWQGSIIWFLGRQDIGLNRFQFTNFKV